MIIQIDRERLAKSFTTLCEIDSPSRKEGKICSWLKNTFEEMGADYIYEDNSKTATRSESGNLIIRFNGNLPDQEGIFFSCHMDTVGPAENVKVARNGDIFTSKGDTILGADDKSGLAAIIELITLLQENKIAHPMIEVVITTCEEIGLIGAKHLEYDKMLSQYGYALDSSGIDHVVIGAPAANKLCVEVKGQAAHAGLCPEAGINALALVAEALTKLKLGRIDAESTRNFGLIEGGVAQNIIPETVFLKGEVRSHSPAKLLEYTDEISTVFEQTLANWQGDESIGKQKPQLKIEIESDYPVLTLDANSPVIKRVAKAAEIVNKEIRYIVAGGGSDANIFCANGMETAIVATGMDKVHTLDEQLDLVDLVSLTELLYGLVVARI